MVIVFNCDDINKLYCYELSFKEIITANGLMLTYYVI